MEYREFSRSGIRASLFGIGCMRLPLIPQPEGQVDGAKVDVAEAIRMIRYGIDHGVTYIDTAWGYHGGASEKVVGLALRDGYRDRVNLATKLPVWEVKTADDFSRIFNAQLERLQTDHLDFYLLHALDRNSWAKVRDLGVLDFLDQKKKSGEIRCAAFSFHDQLPAFKEIVDSYPWDMCQIQLNLLDSQYQAGLAGMRYAAERGIGVVVMEPLRGGMLAAPPPDVQAVWANAEFKRSQVEWAFRWLADKPQVRVILSGVSTMDQLQDNLRIFDAIGSSHLTAGDEEMIRKVQDLYRQKLKVGCTGCNYCVPCPSGVSIPDIFRIYNRYALNGDLEAAQKSYGGHIRRGSDASHCVSCGHCEEACPQKIQIIRMLAEADRILRI
ncbi:MAG TPA: aldo/keto reductase [Clostridiales bacterium]|nr:aldo/keto reductase [Clostridiales bacterium]